MVICPGCKSAAVREVTVGKRRRAECAGCSRFVGWVAESGPSAGAAAEVAEASGAAGVKDVPESPAKVLGNAPTWLFVSKRLDVMEVPNSSFWNVAAFTTGSLEKPVAFYRLSARTLVWLEIAGEAIERQCLKGEVARDQLDAYLAAMNEVWAFADEWLSADAVRAARAEGQRGNGPTLPEFAGPK